MNLDELRSTKIETVEQGNELADKILAEQHSIHRQMIETTDNAKWQELSDKHYDLRIIRRDIQSKTGKLAMTLKKDTK